MGQAGSGGPAGMPGAGATGHACTKGDVPEHRPVPVACAPSPGGAADDGGVSCVTDADCQPDGGIVGFPFCLSGRCGVDQCLTDDDCASGQVCGCSDKVRGLTLRRNSCLPSSCRIDADCGPEGLCSPADNGHCYSTSSYHCRKAADTCCVQADCAAPTPICNYAPELDRWQCQADVVCGG
jgi:hypothetical protein